MTSETPDHILIEDAKTGSREAVAALYHRYLAKITRYVGYRVSDDAAIEDIIAQIFLAMIEQLPRYRFTGAPFEAWLYQIAKGHVADYYRRKKPVEELPDTLHSSETPLDIRVQDRESFDELRSALAQLTDEQQTIIILRFVELKSHEEVAEILGKSTGAIMTAQHRALKQLAALLGTEKDSRHYLRGEK
ncbi:MAG: RNA polymerase sigma factor [Chloroflexi bacterium]|nr:RNA polymerase sigma factor [Chloroflexota bacterium]